MAKAHFVKAARKDVPNSDIKKGESYWWWKFNFSKTKHVSKTQPKPSQLTQSAFLSNLYSIQERINGLNEENCKSKEDFDAFKEEILSDIENLKDECESSLQNMPEHLQESSPTGQTLQERIDGLDQWHTDIENLEVDEDQEDGVGYAMDELQGTDCPL